MVSPRPRPGRDPQEAAKRKEALEKLKQKDSKKGSKRISNDESSAALRKAAQEKIEAARKAKEGPKRVQRPGRERPEPTGKLTKKPGDNSKINPDDLKNTRRTQKPNPDIVVNTEPPIVERAENFGIGPAGPAVIPPNKPILIAGFGPEKQGPAFPMQQQAPAFPMQMMQGMGQGRPSVAQPGPAQMANAQQLQARAQQLQARLNAARGQGGQTRFR